MSFDEYLQHLNIEQRNAAKAVNGPVMIIAGAGSGKTRVLTYRTAYLIHLGVRPESILALTFTNKAANEMKGRIVELVGPASRNVWMGTFHSVFARVLRMECERIGYGRNFTIYDTDDSLGLIKSIMQSLGISQQQYPAQGFRSRISNAKNRLESPAAYRAAGVDPLTQHTATVYEEYERKLKICNAMDFDDLLLKPLELFSRHADVLERYHYRFKYILVDEYQDTNRVQYDLVKILARLNKNICVVGDDAQSIYAFRGADIRNILDFERDYPECQIFRLEQNYRSTKTILQAAGSLIKHNVNQIPKTLWTDNDEGDVITVHACDDDREEGYRIVTRIGDESSRRKLDLKDFAILYRTNAQSRSLEDALRRSGIPYLIVGGVAFYKRKEIKDVLAYLKVIANPKDNESLERILNVPVRGIGATTISKIGALADEAGVPMFESLSLPSLDGTIAARTLKAIRDFHALMKKYIALAGQMSVGELAHSLVDELGLLSVLKEENTPEALARRDNIQELVSALTEFSDSHPESKLEDFLEEVSLVSDVDTAEFGRNAVTLMTLHSAKGLEFPVVFIAGLEEGLFPLGGATTDNDELEEERRLLYVGITRARVKLYLSFAATRYKYGELSYSTKSRFLEEIDPQLLRYDGGTPSTRPYKRAPGTIPSFASGHSTPRRPTPGREESHAFGDSMPDYEGESQDVLLPRVGGRVHHEAFGAGKIVAIDGKGENARAVVDFESVGRKNLMLKFANLRLS